MVRSNYTVDGIELTIVDNETKQIALLKITAIPEPEDHDCGTVQGQACQVCAEYDDGYGKDCA